MLTKDENLQFLQKKICEIKIARFKAEIDSPLQLPNSIVSTLKTDDEGNIWFFSSCKAAHAQNIDGEFYAYLEYYQKGGAYRIRTSGKAMIIHDEGIVPFSKSLKNDYVLVKLKIMHAEYFENKALPTSSFKTRIKDFFAEIFYPQHYREFNFAESVM